METATFTNGQLLLEIKVKPNCSQGKKLKLMRNINAFLNFDARL